MTVVNWGDMNVGQAAPLLEPGFYTVTVGDYEKTTASTGTPQIKYTHKVAEGSEDVIGAPVFDWLALSEAALWRVGAFVQACGMDLKSLPNMELGSEQFWRVINMCKGRQVILELGQKTTPKGKVVNEVKSYMPVDDQEPLEYTDNVPSFIKNKQEPDAATKAKLKKAGLI